MQIYLIFFSIKPEKVILYIVEERSLLKDIDILDMYNLLLEISAKHY